MPTRHGWSAVALAAGLIAAGRVVAVVELYVIGASLLTAVALALVAARLPLPTLGVDRAASPTLAGVGEPLRVELVVRNTGDRTSPRLLLWEPVGEDGGAPMLTPRLTPGSTAGAGYRVPTERRGQLLLGPLQAERLDPLGLCRRRFEVPGSEEVVVVPPRLAVRFPVAGQGGLLGQRLAARALGRSGTEFHSQRAYVAGDDTRRINWKSSARTDSLVVTETRAEGLRRCTVLLDSSDPAYDDEAFERAVIVAASLVAAADESGVDTRLVADGVELAGRGVTAAALRCLAAIERGGAPHDERRSGRSDEGLGLLVIVCATAHAARRAASAPGRSPDDTVVAVHCGAADITSGAQPLSGLVHGLGFVVDASSLERMQVEWGHLVSGTGT
jgi:uncharacterized protein (DUF58 family)